MIIAELMPRDLATVPREEWLCGAVIDQVLDLFNEEAKHSTAACISTRTPEEVFDMANINSKRLVLVANVLLDKKITFADMYNPGDHWVLMIVDLKDDAEVFYCDFVGKKAQENILSEIGRYLAKFGFGKPSRLTYMHEHTRPSPRKCTRECKSYPLQTCGFVCGVATAIVGAIAAIDSEALQALTTEKHSKNCPSYLTDPSRYSALLRRVLLYWIGKSKVDISLLKASPEALQKEREFLPAGAWRNGPPGTISAGQNKHPSAANFTKHPPSSTPASPLQSNNTSTLSAATSTPIAAVSTPSAAASTPSVADATSPSAQPLAATTLPAPDPSLNVDEQKH